MRGGSDLEPAPRRGTAATAGERQRSDKRALFRIRLASNKVPRAMAMSVDRSLRLIPLLEADPDLLDAVPETERGTALRSVPAVQEEVEPGRWRPQPPPGGSLGAILLGGLAVRELSIGKAVSAELLGEGDLLLPSEWEHDEDGDGSPASWTALEPLRVAWLDARTATALRRWPGLFTALLERASRRTGRLATTQAISQLTRVDDRVLALLWQLAQRWGRVTPHGVVLPLRITHRAIARLIGARRPSVTTAISGLERDRLLTRRADGGWLLSGSAPAPELAPVAPGSPWSDRRTGEGAVRSLPGPAAPAYAARDFSQVDRLSVQYAHHAARTSRAVAASKAARARSSSLRVEAMEMRARRGWTPLTRRAG